MIRVKLAIDVNGELNLNVEGAAGSQCLDLTEAAERAVGQVIRRDEKPEASLPHQGQGFVQG